MTIWHMRIAYWIPKPANTHLEYLILIVFPLQQYTNALQCYVIRTLPVLYVLPTECIYAYVCISEQIVFISVRTISIWFS